MEGRCSEDHKELLLGVDIRTDRAFTLCTSFQIISSLSTRLSDSNIKPNGTALLTLQIIEEGVITTQHSTNF